MVGEDGKAVIPRMKIPGTRVSGWTTQPGCTSHSMVSLAIFAFVCTEASALRIGECAGSRTACDCTVRAFGRSPLRPLWPLRCP